MAFTKSTKPFNSTGKEEWKYYNAEKDNKQDGDEEGTRRR